MISAQPYLWKLCKIYSKLEKNQSSELTHFLLNVFYVTLMFQKSANIISYTKFCHFIISFSSFIFLCVCARAPAVSYLFVNVGSRTADQPVWWGRRWFRNQLAHRQELPGVSKVIRPSIHPSISFFSSLIYSLSTSFIHSRICCTSVCQICFFEETSQRNVAASMFYNTDRYMSGRSLDD